MPSVVFLSRAELLPRHCNLFSWVCLLLFASVTLHAQRAEDGIGGRSLDVGLRVGYSFPQNDLKLTTGGAPQIDLGANAERLIHGVHQIRPTLDWWYFRPGRQTSTTSFGSQVLDTRVRAISFGSEYLYRIGGENKRLSVGGGLYLIRWSVASVNTVTLSSIGTTQASGTSHWIRLGEGAIASYRLSRRLEIEGRWIRSQYGYEHIPVAVAVVDAGWRF